MYFRRVFVRCRPFLSADKEEFLAAENDENKDPNVSGCLIFHHKRLHEYKYIDI